MANSQVLFAIALLVIIQAFSTETSFCGQKNGMPGMQPLFIWEKGYYPEKVDGKIAGMQMPFTYGKKYYPRETGRIIGGKDIHIFEFPWIVSLGTGRERHMCGGSLIRMNNKDYTSIVITAAHCFDDTKEGWHATIGCTSWLNLRHGCGSVAVINVTIHPLYNRVTLLNDIALLYVILTSFTQTRQPICLPTPNDEIVPTGAIVYAAGWGRKGENDSKKFDHLSEVDVEVIDNQVCVNSYGGIRRFSPNEMLCAASPGKDTCWGDSGGPLVYFRSRGYTIEGITSFGRGCAHADYPGVYTRVTNYLQWINETILQLTNHKR